MMRKCLEWRFFAWAVVLGAFWPMSAPAATQENVTTRTERMLRPPAVAGSFYPADPKELSALVDGLLSKASVATTSARVRAVIAPHAGYVYSGPVAASAYAALKGQQVSRVVVLAPSHYAEFDGIAITPARYQTPLGVVDLDPLCDRLASHSPFSYFPPAKVHAPSWQRPAQELRPDTFEHSLEVQLPFLQRSLRSFSLIPLVCGRVDPSRAADVLARELDEHTLLVASSDLSHYYPYDMARRLDTQCVQAICSLDFSRMRAQEACGKVPILIVMHIAKRFGWTPVLLDYRNSGDTAGDKSRVVGYAAIAFYEAMSQTPSPESERQAKGGGDSQVSATSEPQKRKNSPEQTSATLTREEGLLLTKLARQALEEAVRHRRRLPVDVKSFPPALQEPRGCFVTLSEHGDLRGCIGHIFPQEPLCLAVVDNAWAAALEDPRFPPVAPHELANIKIEVSVLTVPRPLEFSSPDDLLAKLRPHRDGVVLKIGRAMATFLPQVWEQLPEKETFLAHLSRKAGCAADAWRGPNVSVLIYEVQAFHEPESR